MQAADAVWKRLANNFDIYDEKCFKNAKPIYLKELGLSERKSHYLIGLSDYMSNNKNYYNYWNKLSDDEVFQN